MALRDIRLSKITIPVLNHQMKIAKTIASKVSDMGWLWTFIYQAGTMRAFSGNLFCNTGNV